MSHLEKIGRFGSASKVLSYLSAAWCAGTILTVVILLISGAATSISETLADRNSNGADLAGQVSSLAVGSTLFVLVSGLALARFVLRALPPRVLKGTRHGFDTIRAFALCFLFAVLLYLGVVTLCVVNRVDAASSKPLDKTGLASAGLGAILAMLCMCCAVAKLIVSHRKLRVVLDRPFVLFLRRFSTFADRAVVALVLNQAPSGVPVVFLTPRLSRPGDWDPFLVGFAGFKILHPWKSGPIVLRTSDEDWQQTAEELIRRAQKIVVDTSETSSAMRTEGDMITNTSRWSDTACLRLLSNNAVVGEDLAYSGRARVIHYRKSWVRALPKMVLGLVIVLSTSLVVSIPLAFLPTFMRLLSSIFLLVAAMSIYYSVFVRPTINRDAKLSLRTMLRGR